MQKSVRDFCRSRFDCRPRTVQEPLRDRFAGTHFDALAAVDTDKLVNHRQVVLHVDGFDGTYPDAACAGDTADGAVLADDRARPVVAA